jgi:hypothetical protein
MTVSIFAVSIDAVDAATAAAFRAEALGREVNPGASRDSASLAAREGSDDKQIFFHGVPERKSAKNRLHLDLRPDNFDAELARLLALSATEVASHPHWVTLADPEGIEFDLVRG